MKSQYFPDLLVVMLIGFSCLGSVGGTVANASTTQERESLRDLQSIVLNPINITSTPTDLQADLPLVEVQRQVEAEMREAGIPLLDHAVAGSSGVPRLQIQGAVSQITANYYAYTIVVDLHQVAALVRKTEQRSFVVTWSEGLLSTGDIKKFHDRLLFLTRLFIEDFQSVNAPSSQVWPLNWQSPSPAPNQDESSHF